MSAQPAISLEAEPLRFGKRALRDDLFGPQPTGRADLPDPEALLLNLARSAVEILAGARELEQIARWVSEDVYRALVKRVILAERARRLKRASVVRPVISLGELHLSEPRDGVIEAVVVVRSRARARAVAIRLEGFDRRWKATALSVL